MTQGYQLDHSLSQRLLKHFFDNVLFENVGLIHVLPLAVHKSSEQVSRGGSGSGVVGGWPIRF